MNRLVTAASSVGLLLALAACGSNSSAAGASSSSASAGAAGARGGVLRNGAAGELVQINGTKLVLNTQNGDVNVVYDGSTLVMKTSTGSVADIVTGTCILASGQKDATGAITASVVRVSDKVNGTCSFGRGRTAETPGATPRPTPRPGQSNFAAAAGEVLGVSNTTVTVRDPMGTTRSVTIPTTVRVSRSAAASASDLAVGDCVLANGRKDASGTVAARTLSIVPAGPSGCFSGGGGGFGRGGFGGGFAGGGAGGGQPVD
jgi:hypothetical protein